jgi:hypothetical protein
MATKDTTPTSGGNTPKPGGAGGQSAKDRSRAQSRSIPAKGGTGGGKGGGNTPRPGKAASAPPPRSGPSTAVLTWGGVAAVVIVVVVIVIVALSGGSNGNSDNAAYTPVTPAPASVVHDVTSIPASVFNTVGVSSTAVTPPSLLSTTGTLTLDGKSPTMLYIGGEYCPYCAAERWAMIAALSRFGTFSDLKITASSHTDVYPITHTFSFHGSTYSSPYLTFDPKEIDSNVPDTSSASGYTPLDKLTSDEQKTASKYSGSSGISCPFVAVDDRVLVSGASYSPELLQGLDWSTIAGGLHDPTNPITQAIVTTANYLTASICSATHGQPADVCTSKGVRAAAAVLKLG